MATVTKGKTFISGETVEPADMHQLVDAATVTNIVDADIGSGAAIAASKLAATLDLSSKTVTLPDDSVTNAKLSLAANDGEIKKALNADNDPPIYACRAWVNFDGTTVTNVGGENRCTIRGNGNVSKVVRSAAGVYVVHFTLPMPSVDYVAVVSGAQGLSANDNFTSCHSYTTTTVSVQGCNTTGSASPHENMAIMSVAVFA
jgi:hypothetical protein